MQKDNPSDELKDLDRIAKDLGLFVEIDFEGCSGIRRLTAKGLPEDPGLAARYMAIGNEIVENEIGAHWADGEGSVGTITICGDGLPNLKADSRVEDHAYDAEPILDDTEWPNPANRISLSEDGPSGP